MSTHKQASVSGLGRNQLSLHPSSLNLLQLPNPLVNASMPPIISVYLMDNYYYPCFIYNPPTPCKKTQAKRGWKKAQDHRSKGQGSQDSSPGLLDPKPCYSSHHNPTPGSIQRKQRLRASSLCRSLPKFQETKELDESWAGNVSSWGLKVETDRTSEDQQMAQEAVPRSLRRLSTVTQARTILGQSLRLHGHSRLKAEQPFFSERQWPKKKGS